MIGKYHRHEAVDYVMDKYEELTRLANQLQEAGQYDRAVEARSRMSAVRFAILHDGEGLWLELMKRLSRGF